MNEARNTLSGAVAEPKRHSLLVDLIIRLVREKPLGTTGGAIVLVLLLTGIFADFLAPYGVNEIHLADRISPPSAQYILGTDDLGRDMLSRIIYGARISMIVSVLGSTLSVLINIGIGVPSGFINGKFDLIVQRFVDAWISLPFLIILLMAMSLTGPGMTQIILLLGVAYGIRDSRVVRAAVVGIKENIYIEAAKAIGCSTWRMLTVHILPNVMAPIIILFTLAMGQMIIAEAALSFLGFGIPPPAPSWGGMLSLEGRVQMLQGPWMAIWPGLALTIAVFSINMLGDAVRDILDPRLRGGVGRYGTVKTKKPR